MTSFRIDTDNQAAPHAVVAAKLFGFLVVFALGLRSSVGMFDSLYYFADAAAPIARSCAAT